MQEWAEIKLAVLQDTTAKKKKKMQPNEGWLSKLCTSLMLLFKEVSLYIPNVLLDSRQTGMKRKI